MSAIRLARAATGRETLIKFAGAYHGHVDGLLAEAGSGLATQGIPASPGVPEAATRGTVIVPWNDADAVRTALREHEVAALLAEPYPANMGLVPPDPDSSSICVNLPRSTAPCSSSTRSSPASASRAAAPRSSRASRRPHRHGQGHRRRPPRGRVRRPAGADEPHRAGRRRLPGGTLSGNPLAVAAGRATLERLDEDAYVRLAATTETLAEGLREAAGDASGPARVGPGPAHRVLLRAPVRDYAGAAACDAEAYGEWCRALLARGVYPPPSQFEAWFPSLAHTPEHVTRTLEAAAAAFEEIAMTALAALAAALREDGGLLAAALADAAACRRDLGAAAAAGPRAAGREDDYALLVEAIVEGYLQHYGEGRVVRPDDPDLALLAGDRLYALGLARLAELGDLAAVAELADVISLAAQAHAEGDPDRAGAIWQAGAAAVGHGTGPSTPPRRPPPAPASPTPRAALRAAVPAR